MSIPATAAGGTRIAQPRWRAYHVAVIAKRDIVALWVAVLLLLCPLASIAAEVIKPGKAGQSQTQPGEAALLADLGDGFSVYRSKHFALVSDVSAALAKRMENRLEEAYRRGEALCRMLRIRPTPPEQPLQIILFDHFEDYAHYAKRVGLNAEGTGGFYNEAENRGAFFNVFNDELVQEYNDKLDRLEASGTQPPVHMRRLRRDLNVQARDAMEVALRHELAHQVQHNLGILRRGSRKPVWWAEGLACLFEIDSTGARRGLAVNQARLKRFRQAEGAQALMSLRSLVTASRPDSAADLDQADVFYAQSWTLCYYLVKRRPAQVARYLEILRERKPGFEPGGDQELADFETAFGQLDARFERAFLRAMARLRSE